MTKIEFDTKVFLKGITILVIDGDPISRKLLKDTLSTFGFTQVNCIEKAEDIEKAISSKRIGIIITDWKVDGYNVGECVKKMRDDRNSPNRYTPVLLITGRSSAQEVKKARDMGFTEFMLKPFSVKILRNKLIEIIEYPRNFIISRNFNGPDRRRKVVKVKHDKRKK